MIRRKDKRTAIDRALSRNPAVILAGPRQVGKTTLAREFVPADSVNYFDLEDPASLARLDEPTTALGGLEGLVVIDEIQRRPDLFPTLRVLIDRSDRRAHFLLLGSASGDLLRQSSESLAGRIEQVELGGFQLAEVGAARAQRLWFRGGFPRSFLASSDEDSLSWCREFALTLLERDFPQWGVGTPAATLRRFWSMLAHYHGQTWNGAEIASGMGVSQGSVRRYLDLLTDAFMIRQLPPWIANLGKRQVRSPKIYVRDSGLLHHLLGVATERDLVTHPKIGASWEGFAIEQALAAIQPDAAYFWATHQGAEVDLVLEKNGRLLGIECKRADAPRRTRSMTIALEDLGLERLVVLYPGEKRYPISDEIEAVPVTMLEDSELTLFSS